MDVVAFQATWRSVLNFTSDLVRAPDHTLGAWAGVVNGEGTGRERLGWQVALRLHCSMVPAVHGVPSTSTSQPDVPLSDVMALACAHCSIFKVEQKYIKITYETVTFFYFSFPQWRIS